MTPNAASAYQTQNIMTASPAHLVVMLYERALRALRDAKRSIEIDDIQGRHTHNKRAVDIVSHLWSTLDMDKGGEIATNLADIYKFMIRRLGDVDMRNDPTAADEVIALLEPLSESWRQIAAGTAKAPVMPRLPQVQGARPASARAVGSLALSA